MFKLRNYQQESVKATLQHFRRSRAPAVIVLPTGAGKSLVIAELARLAKGRVLVVAHVRELVEQNYLKFTALGISAGIFSAGLERKDEKEKTIFGSIQSVARAPDDFFQSFSLLIIDECHRVSVDGDTQYNQVILKLKRNNPNLCILGLTATPYRLGFGWIYEYHQQKQLKVTDQERFFKKCVFELSLRYMIENNFLTPPLRIDSPVACYDFSSLKIVGTHFVAEHVQKLLQNQKRITPAIVNNIIELSAERKGVMIFTSSVHHAEEILKLLPSEQSALVIGDTEDQVRDRIISEFKSEKLKYLVNVSVLTTGFDAPHVDVIAILRPTESTSLYQQIVGRGLRLFPGKKDCLILDYTGQAQDLFSPEIEDSRPATGTVIVPIPCPVCRTINEFWGLLNPDGFIEEHFGRKCRGAKENPKTKELIECGYLFRFKRCDRCGLENDISARQCKSCQNLLMDPDQKLKEAMALKDAHIMKVDTMIFAKTYDQKKNERLEIQYFDVDANVLKEYFYLNSFESQRRFYYEFVRMHNRRPERELNFVEIDAVLASRHLFRSPTFVIARKQKKFWTLREKIFYS